MQDETKTFLKKPKLALLKNTMKKTQKNAIGILGLIFVIAMTVFAYTLPDPVAEPAREPKEIASIEQ